MSNTHKLIITLLIILNVTTTFGMRPRGSSTRPPDMQLQENFIRGMAATVAPVQSTQHQPRSQSSTMESQPGWIEIEVPAPSPSGRQLSSTSETTIPEADQSLHTTQDMHLKIEEFDKDFLKKIINPQTANPIGVNDHIIIDPSEFYAITPLGLAAFWGWPDIIDQLCRKGAYVNEPMPPNTLPNLKGLTPLHIATVLNRIQAAQALLAYSADVNAQVKSTTQYNGFTPLDFATMQGPQFRGMAELLVRHGAQKSSSVIREGSPDQQSLLLTQYRTQNKMKEDPTAFDMEGQTPLTNAIRKGNVALVQTLISQGSNPDTPIAAFEHNSNSYAGFSPLCLATYSGNSAIVETLLQHGANPNYIIKNNPKGWNGFSPLHIAIIRNNPELVMRLINHHAEINKPMAPDKGYQLTPLGLAASMGYSNIIQILSQKGATIDYTVDGFTPLHHAILQKHYKAFLTLINNGATINAIVNRPSHELHNFNTVCLALYAPEDKSLPILVQLIRLGADIQYTIKSASKFNAYTPLILAVLTRNLPAIKYLVGAGIDLRKESFLPMALNLLKQSAPQATYAAIESYIGKAHLSQQLLEMSRQFNQIFLALCDLQKQNKDIPMDVLAPDQLSNITGILKTIQNILVMGADPDIKNKKGGTPLLFAIARTNFVQETLSDELVSLLLAQGADPNIASYEGISPLSLATSYNNIRVVKKLLEAGADPQPDLGQQPLEIARAQKYTDIEKLLEKAIKGKTKKPSRVSRVFSTLSKTLRR